MMNESCVETPAAPEWLSKLESRREKLTQRRLGHETGAGAPCKECGVKCPGLDLHFWRKVCRNCKCRKEQHECGDDDLSGWAQFEILGQIRSKPAYINIRTFADKPVKLDWVPPNVETDIVSDYMIQLGSNNIPVAGSDAAAKRKQQLEFQVPPHDLDPTLCHNLTEKEEQQLQQYVDKIKQNSVGQGSIVRLQGPIKIGQVSETMAISPIIYKDKMASFILNSEIVQGILQTPSSILPGTILKTSINQPMIPDFHQSPILSDKIKYKLNTMKINSQGIQSGTVNGPFYDQILTSLKENNINYDYDNILKPLDEFRNMYGINDNFRNEVNQFVKSLGDRFLDTIPELIEEEEFHENQDKRFATPKKQNQEIWNSPLPVKHLHSKQGQIVQQDTPMRKIKFDKTQISAPNNAIRELYNPNTGYPIVPTIERDPLISALLNSDAVQGILNDPSRILSGTKLVITKGPVKADFLDTPYMSEHTKDKLKGMDINSQAIQSGVVHGWAYDKIIPNLNSYNIDYCDDFIIPPLEKLRKAMLTDEPFRNEVQNYVKSLGDQMIDKIPLVENAEINKSKSSDSGFESIPPTPNYATFPGLEDKDIMKAVPGQLVPIPGIADMSIYSDTEPKKNHELEKKLANIAILDPIELDEQRGILKKNKSIICQHCNLEIVAGEVAVQAERAGKDVAWHPQCFVCNKCGELLADLVYFFHSGKVYCARDLADILKIPRCNACDELIFTKEYTAAEGCTFHIKHFCCYQCDKPLAGQQYLPDVKTNMPLCFTCYDKFHAETCQKCKKIIGPTEQGVAWNKVHWHGDCFSCSGVGCQKNLIGGRFMVKNEMPFCSAQCVQSIIH